MSLIEFSGRKFFEKYGNFGLMVQNSSTHSLKLNRSYSANRTDKTEMRIEEAQYPEKSLHKMSLAARYFKSKKDDQTTKDGAKLSRLRS